MRLFPTSRRNRGVPTGAAAFTMVEIALCIAIVAIAMVAIMGVMPTGLNVQKQNREDTIIDQEAQILLDAIRGGSMRYHELTNYLDYIVVTHQPTNGAASIAAFRGRFFDWPANSPLSGLDQVPAGRQLLPEDIVGLLSLPKLDVRQDRFGTNQVIAQMRAFTGPLDEKVRPVATGTPRTDRLDFAFRYQVTAEISLMPSGPETQPPFVGRDFGQRPIYDVRLTFQWPVYQSAGEFRVGNSQKSYHTQIAGQLVEHVLPGERTSQIFRSRIFRRRLNTGSLDLQ